MADYLAQIAVINTKIAALEIEIPGLIQSSNSWRNDSQNSCSGSKKKKRACEAEKVRKIGIANQRMAIANAKKSEIEELRATKETLEASQKAKDEATVNLSTTGQSLEALVIQADGKAEADKQAANIIANAQADATRLKANVEAENLDEKAEADLVNSEKQNNTMMIVIVIVVLIGVAFGVMKLKKMAK